MGLDIKHYRKRAGLTQLELCSILEITPKTFRSWENGTVWPNANQLCNLATVLKCTPNDLCRWYEEHPEDRTQAVELLSGYQGADHKTRHIVNELLGLEKVKAANTDGSSVKRAFSPDKRSENRLNEAASG